MWPWTSDSLMWKWKTVFPWHICITPQYEDRVKTFFFKVELLLSPVFIDIFTFCTISTVMETQLLTAAEWRKYTDVTAGGETLMRLSHGCVVMCSLNVWLSSASKPGGTGKTHRHCENTSGAAGRLQALTAAWPEQKLKDFSESLKLSLDSGH